MPAGQFPWLRGVSMAPSRRFVIMVMMVMTMSARMTMCMTVTMMGMIMSMGMIVLVVLVRSTTQQLQEGAAFYP